MLRTIGQVLVAMCCAPWLPDYVGAMKVALPSSSPGFHPLNNGMDFRRPFRCVELLLYCVELLLYGTCVRSILLASWPRSSCILKLPVERFSATSAAAGGASKETICASRP